VGEAATRLEQESSSTTKRKARNRPREESSLWRQLEKQSPMEWLEPKKIDVHSEPRKHRQLVLVEVVSEAKLSSEIMESRSEATQ
jgi:hypothetical protein